MTHSRYPSIRSGNRPEPVPLECHDLSKSSRIKKASDIKHTFERHPDIVSAEVHVFLHKAGHGLAKNVAYHKYVFTARLTLANGKRRPFVTSRPKRSPDSTSNGTINEFQSTSALWNRIKNRYFLEEHRDIEPFLKESEKRRFEREVKILYSKSRNVSPKCLSVRLLTIDESTAESRRDFASRCVDRNRYYCEVSVRLPGTNGSPGPLIQVDHVSLRDLKKTHRKIGCFEHIRDLFIRIQSRYIQPIREFNIYSVTGRDGHSRKKLTYRVCDGEPHTEYTFAINNPSSNPPCGKRFFGRVNERDRFLSLAVGTNQCTGKLELKWCMTQDHKLRDKKGEELDIKHNNLYSLIRRYKDEARTPERVRGNTFSFKVCEVLCFVHGPFDVIQELDTIVKRATKCYGCSPRHRKGKTEYRRFDSKERCIGILSSTAKRMGLAVVFQRHASIPMDRFIGNRPESPEDWILKAVRSSSRTR